MRYNISNLDDFPMDNILDRGTYEVVIDSLEMKETAKGGQMIAMELTVIDGEAQTNGSSPHGRKLFHNLILPDSSHKDGGMAAGSRLRQMCEAFAIPYDSTGFDGEEAVGRNALAVVTHEEYQGEAKARVSRFRSPAN